MEDKIKMLLDYLRVDMKKLDGITGDAMLYQYSGGSVEQFAYMLQQSVSESENTFMFCKLCHDVLYNACNCTARSAP